MSTERIKKAILLGWDDMSERYQADTRISLEDVHYAPLSPGERELQLIGGVQGKTVLELACGAAQNSIALSRWGARVTAMDFSPKQLQKARELVTRENVRVNLVRGDMECLSMFKDASFDIVLSSFGWEFVPDLRTCFNECNRVLRSRGLLIVGTVHPLAAFEWDQDEKSLLVTDYFNPSVEVWDEPSDQVGQRGLTFFHTIEEMFGLLTSSGFSVERIAEPYPYPLHTMSDSEKGAIPYSGPFWEKQYDRLRRVPFSIIYRGASCDQRISHSGHHGRAGISSCRLRRASPIRNADASRCPGCVIHTIADRYPDTLAYRNANGLPISYSNRVAHTGRDAYSHGFAYPYSDGHSYRHTYPHCHAFTLAYRHPDSYTDGHSDAIADPHTLTQPDAFSNQHASANVHPHVYAPTDGKSETV